MHRQNLLQLLINYNPFDTNEVIVKQRMLEFIGSNRDCFMRTCEGGHFTASCWLVNPDFDKALLIYHEKLGMWVQPGGHADGESDLLEVALREAKEESGVQNIIALSPEIFDIDIHTVPARLSEPEHLHFDVRFLLQVADDAQTSDSANVGEIIWISDDVNSLPTKDPSVIRMFNKWQWRKSIRTL